MKLTLSQRIWQAWSAGLLLTLLFATAIIGFRQLADDVTLQGARQQRRDAKTARLAAPTGVG